MVPFKFANRNTVPVFTVNISTGTYNFFYKIKFFSGVPLVLLTGYPGRGWLTALACPVPKKLLGERETEIK